jgi:hypothetical protein
LVLRCVLEDETGKEAKNMIVEVTDIVAGLVLAVGILPYIPGVGKSLEKVAKWLGGFQTIIGIIAIIIGIGGLLLRNPFFPFLSCFNE